jgi:hypothetical protein
MPRRLLNVYDAVVDATVRTEFFQSELRSGVTFSAVVLDVKVDFTVLAKLSLNGKVSARIDSRTMMNTCLIGFFKVTKGRQMLTAGARIARVTILNAESSV